MSQTVYKVPETKNINEQFVLSAELSCREETDTIQMSLGQDVL